MFKKLSVKISRGLIVGLVLLCGLLTVAVAAPVGRAAALASSDAVCEGAGLAAGGGCAAPAGTPTVGNTVVRGIQIFVWIVGAIAVFMVIIGGLKFITSGGDPAKTASAKDTILYAAIGLVVVALAQFIVRFVLNKL